jgi:hypothetical protein
MSDYELNTNQPMSAEIVQAIDDSQKLIAHIANSGSGTLDPKVTAVLVESKFKLMQKNWTVADENNFLTAYDLLACQVYPVTIDSINAITPPKSSKKNTATKADKAVSWYRRFTMLTLLVLLLVQVYWLVGNDLRSNLQQLFEQRKNTLSQLKASENNQLEYEDLTAKLSLENQKLDANYKFLMLWNQAWLMGSSFSDAMPKYLQAKYEQDIRLLERNQANNIDQLEKLTLERNLYQVRMVLFEHILAADFILKVLQEYFLPLLYGLFGAFIYVLRNLMREIKARTYAYDCEVKYRLRLTLGALGGLIISWFLQPDDSNAMASLSPMAMAFIMGYNIELLFSVMDRIIENMREAIEKPKSTPAATTSTVGTKPNL